MADVFSHRFRVRYAEVDPQSVVFNSRYLEYADIIITEYWRALGIHFTGDDALEFHVARAEVDFVQPLRADEWVIGKGWTEKVGTSSVTTKIELHGESGDDLRSTITLIHVHVDLESGKAIPVPDPVRALMLGEKGPAHD